VEQDKAVISTIGTVLYGLLH